MKGCIEACEDKGRVVVIGDMNDIAGDSEVEGVVGKFEVSGTTENGKKLIELRREWKLNVANACFEKDIHDLMIGHVLDRGLFI